MGANTTRAKLLAAPGGKTPLGIVRHGWKVLNALN
jgi:hypothetical protein